MFMLLEGVQAASAAMRLQLTTTYINRLSETAHNQTADYASDMSNAHQP